MGRLGKLLEATNQVQERESAAYSLATLKKLERTLAQSVKRGGSDVKVSLADATVAVKGQDLDVVALDEALTRLAEIDEQQSRVVELRFFSGLTVEETAEVMGISPATVKRDWSMAKAWLHRELSREI